MQNQINFSYIIQSYHIIFLLLFLYSYILKTLLNENDN